MQSSLHITLQNAGKRFNRDWIFRKFDHTFKTGKSYAITGPNGSGKSTLLQCIAASTQISEGTVECKSLVNDQSSTINDEDFFKHIAIVAPYLEVIEEMTATEFLQFHASFKPLLASVTIPEILETIGLQAAANKQIRFYSSGMKQRIKLAQAVFSDVPVLLLDEPCTNLDASGYDLYHRLINDFCKEKLIIVSSNDINEYDFCTEKLSITDYKQVR
ncbi:ABC transporter ATP-binding protein [soil metagenome]